MYNNNQVNIGMFGLGTVGKGVVKYLNQFYDPEKTGLELNIAKICVQNISKKRDVRLRKGVLTANPDDILENPEIDVVVEVMGGIEPAGSYILRALENEKHVVTANKAFLTQQRQEDYRSTTGEQYKLLLAEGKWPKDLGGYLVFISALSRHKNIGFEASVCGEIPVIDVVFSIPSNKDVVALEGIINGTSNYILTRMSGGASYEKALSQAQKKGLAEADPSFDVDGIDAAQKLAILSTLIFGYRVDVSQILRESISTITQQDIRYANEFKYVIKPLASVKRYGEELLELRVGPTLIKPTDNLANINDETNAVSLYFKGRDKPLTLSGEGAGMMPTGRAVVTDIVSVVKNSPESRERIYNLFTCPPNDFSELVQQLESSSYLRINVENRVGVLGDIASFLGAYGISIEEVRQKKEDQIDKTIPLVMLLESAKEEKIRNAVEAIKGFDFVKDVLRIRRKE